MATGKRQLTPFQSLHCTSKRARRAGDVEDSDISDENDDAYSDLLDSDDDDGSSFAAGTHRTLSNHSQQTNTIQIDKPVGATTIIINTDSENCSRRTNTEVEDTTHGQTPQNSSTPSDLSGIGASLTRPKNVCFPLTNFSGKNRSFNAK